MVSNGASTEKGTKSRRVNLIKGQYRHDQSRLSTGNGIGVLVGLKFWCCQNVGSNPGLAGHGACVLVQDT